LNNKDYFSFKSLSFVFLVFLINTNLSAQTATCASNSYSPMMTIGGSNYQGYCIQINDDTPYSGLGYTLDNTHDIVDDDVSACLRGRQTYGVNAVQNAIWHFTDNHNPSSGSSAWSIINRVNNGTYLPSCASEWTCSNSSYQDICCDDDPHCRQYCDPKLTIHNDGPCDLDLYFWDSNGDVFEATIATGGSYMVTTTDHEMWRVIEGGGNISNPAFSDSYTVQGCHDQSWNPNDPHPAICVNQPAVGPTAPNSWAFDCDDNQCVEIIGKGTKNSVPKTLNIPNSGNVTQIVVEATWNFHAPDWVVFKNASGQEVSANEQTLQDIGCGSGGSVYRTVLNAASSVTLESPLGDIHEAESFIAYIYRQGNVCGGGSYGVFNHSCIYRNMDMVEIPIEETFGPRNIDFVVPLSEITNDGRIATVEVSACGITETKTINNFNEGNSLNLVNLTLNNVPGDCNSVKIKVISPNNNGQSLFFSGAVEVITECVDCDLTIDCPPNVTIECDESFDPANTGNPVLGDCPNAEVSYEDSQSGVCPVIINRTWTYTLNQSGTECIPVNLAHWNFANANHRCSQGQMPLSGNGLAPSSVNNSSCSNLQIGNLGNAEKSSCVQGVFGSAEAAICLGDQDDTSFKNNDDDAAIFTVSFGNNDAGRITGFCFYERAIHFNENFGNNNPPKRYGVRVTKNGTEIFKQTGISTTDHWSLEDFDFSNNNNFSYSGNTTFSFEVLGYNANHPNTTNAWELDEFVVKGCCGTTPSTSLTETCVQTITIFDTENPTLSNTPNDVTIECDEDLPDPNGVVADDNCAFQTELIETSTQTNNGQCTDFEYVVTRTWTVTDDCGNSAVHTQDITVEDSTSPNIGIPAEDLIVECDGNGNTVQFQDWLDSQGGAIATDNCSDVSWTFNSEPLSNDCAATGDVTITFIASDICGNSSLTTATFMIMDRTDPSIDTPADDLTVECDGLGNTGQLQDWLNDNGGGRASDECGGFTWSYAPDPAILSNECGATGEVTVTFTVTDECDNTNQTTATFTIIDTTQPSIDTAADDLVVECDGLGNTGQLQDWLDDNGGGRASDECGDFEWTNNFSGLNSDCGQTGNVTVTFTATDDCDNTNQTTATFTIIDTTPVEFTIADDLTVECDGLGNTGQLQGWLNSNGGATATDVCSEIEWTNNFTGLSDDCGETGEATVTFTATDDCGNSINTTATFVIVDTTIPSIDTPSSDLIVQCDGLGNTGQLQDWLNSNGGAIATDICSNFEWTNDFTMLTNDCGETGEATVTFTVTDDCGNSDVTTAMFTIIDDTPPMAICQDITIQLDQDCDVSITPDDINNMSEDVCGDIVNVELDELDFTCIENEGNNTVTLTVTDDCGNTNSCTANVRIERFDLALRTVLAPGEDDRVYPFQDVTFKIEVHNQGSLPASNIQVTNYIPAGFALNDNDWNGNGNNATITLPGTLAPGAMTMVEITLRVTTTTPGPLVNRAEISSADAPNGFTSTDVDSNADNINGNDSGGQVNTDNDDEIDEGCCSIDGDDEDDEDPEDVMVEVFDLALNKVLAPGEDDRVYTGQDITFTITVFNQGTVPAQNVVIEDYIPAGLTLNDAAWTQSGSSASFNVPGTINPGAEFTTDITFTVTQNTQGQIINRAEIHAATDDLGTTIGDGPGQVPDLDSQPDSNPGNDQGGVVNTNDDDNISEDGREPNEDEDDADPEDVFVEIFDLALNKVLGAGEDERVYPTQDITFTITVFNQGTVTAENIVIEDYIPAGLTLNDAAWTNNGATASYNVPGSIAPGASATVDITFTVTTETEGQIINRAEVHAATDDLGDPVGDNQGAGEVSDIDSTPDSNPGNDSGGVVNTGDDDNVNGDGKNGGDEDDADPEDIMVEIFDLALAKKLAPGEDERVYPGQDITFIIEVTNQGSVQAQNITLVDYIPAGLSLNDADWNQSGGQAEYNLGVLNPGQTSTVEITFTVTQNVAGQIINRAEVHAATDGLGDAVGNGPGQVPDLDSTPDSTEGNDSGGVVNTGDDDNISEDGKDGGDEDDADPEDITVEIFDLALNKVLGAGEDEQVYPGQDITFTITVFNQGTNASYNVPGSIAAGGEFMVDITFTVTQTTQGQIINRAEVHAATDDLGTTIGEAPGEIPDIDSTPDSNPGNDNGGVVNTGDDDNVSEDGKNGGDEDDADPEDITVEVFDLALNKVLGAGEDERVYPGQDITFTITVFNQGKMMQLGLITEQLLVIMCLV